MNLNEISISKVDRNEIDQLFALVKELAEYENAPTEVTATLEEYLELFDSSWYDALVAKYANEVIGCCIYYRSFSTWKGKMLYLEDFVVKKEFRRTGVGQILFDGFLNLAKDMGCVLAKWQVLDWNEPAIKFYEKNKSTFDKEWWNCKMYF